VKVLDSGAAARDAVSASSARPAMATLLDTPDARLLVFRIEPGQSVAPHHSASTVTLTVLEGEGIVLGNEGERVCRPGEIVVYEPGETHGMRAVDQTFKLLATIAPRPGERRGV
jgi:quercetin dioxygenase-like cupin family protein